MPGPVLASLSLEDSLVLVSFRRGTQSQYVDVCRCFSSVLRVKVQLTTAEILLLATIEVQPAMLLSHYMLADVDPCAPASKQAA